MRTSRTRIALSTLALVLLVAPAVGATVAPGHLTVTSRKPLTVVGAGFKAREHVRLTVGATPVVPGKTIVATASGRFTAVWTSADLSCGGFTVKAVGARGTSAFTKALMRMCAPIQP